MCKVSIIMPCFNCEKYLEEAFDSVLAQTFSDWELIFINDGSTDDSLQIAQKYADKDNRIKVMDQINQGVIAARNNAIATALGEYIFPLDSDDKISPNCLEILYGIMERNKSQKYAVAVPKFSYFGYESFTVPMPRPTNVNIYTIRFWNVVSSMFRKKDFDAIGGFDETFKKGAEDTDLWLSFIDRGGKMFLSDDILFFYRGYNPDNAINRNADAHRIHRQEILRKLMEKHPKMKSAKKISSFMRTFFESSVSRETVRVSRILRIPIRTKYREKK